MPKERQAARMLQMCIRDSYYTAYYFIQGENALSLANGISTFKVAVTLAVGIALVLGLPMPSGHAWKRK